MYSHDYHLIRLLDKTNLLQVEIVDDTSALAEAGHTPRQEFVRSMLAMGRVPIPILLRDPSNLQGLNLAHKGLGDDVICAAAEVRVYTADGA